MVDESSRSPHFGAGDLPGLGAERRSDTARVNLVTRVPAEAGRLRFGPYEADLRARRLWADGKRVRLQRQVFDLLACLLERPRELIVRDELCARLWPGGTFVDFEHGLNTAVRKLRQAFGDSAESPLYVETVVGRGYRFLARVDACAPEPIPVRETPDSSGALLGHSPFVGRETELGALAARLQEAREGRGGVVLVAGEPGIGKTRLLEEFAERASREGALVLAGRCTQVEWSASYGPFSEALAAWARGAEEQTLRDVVEPPWSGVVAKIIPLLRERLPDLPEPAALRPDEERVRLLDAVAQLFAGLAKREPIALLLDDLHWADPGTMAVLTHLAGVSKRTPLLILGSYRDVEIDRTHPLSHLIDALGRGRGFEQIPLAGLGSEPVRRWIEAVSSGASDAALVDAVHRATGGNPFFVRELLLAWLRGEWGFGGGIESLPVPRTVRDMVAQHLSKLSDEARRLLGAASAFHGVFYFDAARVAAGLDEDAALDALDDAHAAQLVRAAGGPNDYDFVHALIRHVLYDALAPARRVRLHRRIAEELQLEAAAGAPPRSAEIADHYHRSRELPGAEAGVAPALAATARAESVANLEGAARFLGMALDLLPAADPRRARVLARHGIALAWSGSLEEASRVASEAGESLAAGEGAAVAADYLADAADALWWASLDSRAWAIAEAGLRYTGGRRDLVWARLMAHALSGREAFDPLHPGVPRESVERRELSRTVLEHPDSFGVHEPNELWRCVVFDSRDDVLCRTPTSAIFLGFWAGEYRTARAAMGAAAETALREHRVVRAALLLAIEARFASALGELEAAEFCFTRAQALTSLGAGSPLVGLTLGGARAELTVLYGEGFEPGLPLYEAAFRLDAPEARSVMPLTRAGAAYAYAQLEDAENALRNLEALLGAVGATPGWSPYYPLTLHLAIGAFWTLGRRDSGDTLERNLRSKVLAPDFRFAHADARLSLARLCALTGRFDEAREWFARARFVLDEQGARPLRAITDFDEAWMYLRRARRGDKKRALPLLDAAVAQFESIGMPGWVRRAEEMARS